MKPMLSPVTLRATYGALVASLGLLVSASPVRAAVAPVATPLGDFREHLQAPGRLAMDTAGRVYITDPRANHVVVIEASGQLSAVVDGFAGPLGIAVDGADNIYVGEEDTGSVTVFDSQWGVLGVLGQGDGEFALPNHIAVDRASGDNTVYLSDSKVNQIGIYRNRSLVTRFGGQGTASGQFNFPAGVFVSPAGEVFVVDQSNDRVQVFDRAGSFLRLFTLRPPGTSGKSGRAQGITGDNQGRLYVTDSLQGLIRVFDEQGTFLSSIGGWGDRTGQFRSPGGLVINAPGGLFVAAANNSRVELYQLTSPAAPMLTILLNSAGDVVVSWDAVGYDLEAASAVTGNWLPVPGATSPFTTVKTDVQAMGLRFFRLHRNP